MALGFVLIGVEPGHEGDVFKRLLEEPAIQEIFPLFGDYDLIAKVTAPDHDALGQIIVARIRRLEGIRETVTLAAMPPL